MQSYQAPRRSSGRARRNIVRATAVATLCTFVSTTWASDGTAAVILGDARPGFAATPFTHPATDADKKVATPKAEETYQERHDRIAESPRSLLTPTEEQRNTDTTCVSGEFTTLRVVFDSIFESTLPSLPASMHAEARRQQANAHREMARLHVSTLAVSENATTLGADADDPVNKYRSPISQLIVSNLLKIRDGKAGDAIAVENLTLSQAVETAWLYFFAGVLAPTQIGIGLLPRLGSPLDDTSFDQFASSLSYNTLLSIGFQVTRLGLNTLYSTTSRAILNQCVAQVTDEQKEAAGKPSEDVVYNLPIPAILQETANQLALADAETCTPIGDLSLGRIVTRTSEQVQSTMSSAAEKRRVKTEADRILAGMRGTPVPHNLIPADPADFSQLETIASYIGGMIPYVGGAPFDIIVGLGHNLGKGDNLLATVPLSDLTVTKSLTAAYYSYYLSLHLLTTAGGLLEPEIPGVTELPISPTRWIGVALGLPMTYGLISFHHVVRGMCFIEDDTSGTGKGAEANRMTDAERDEAREQNRAAQDSENEDTQGSAAEQSPARPASEKTTPKPVAPIPGLPDWLPIPR